MTQLVYVKNLTVDVITINNADNVNLLQLAPQNQTGDRSSVDVTVAGGNPGFMRLWQAGKVSVYSDSAYATLVAYSSGLPAPVATASNASTSAPGSVQLAGDLAGTATSPTVVGVHGTSTATATAGSVAPTNFVGFITLNLNGAAVKVPYYNV